MNNEYIIINKTAIQKRIEELEKFSNSAKKIGLDTGNIDDSIELFNDVLSQSTPLIPEIEKAWKDGRDGTEVVGSFPFISTKYVNKNTQQYISNLKLDI